MAAARNVSPAASTTFAPCSVSRLASLPMVVVLPVPLTPATRMTNGFFAASMASGFCDRLQHLGDLAARIVAHFASR